MYHVADKSIIFYFHYVFAYGLVVCIIASFIIKIIQIPDFYRKKYLPILVLMCVITVSKFICGILEFPIDVSLPFFVCAAILICYLTLYRSPRELVDKTLSIVVTEMNNAVICFDINNECVYANERALKIFNSSLDSISGISEDVQGWIKKNMISTIRLPLNGVVKPLLTTKPIILISNTENCLTKRMNT